MTTTSDLPEPSSHPSGEHQLQAQRYPVGRGRTKWAGLVLAVSALVILVCTGCEYAVQIDIPLGVDITFFTANATSVSGRVVAPDGGAIENAQVRLQFAGYTWVGDHYEYSSFSQTAYTDAWGYFTIDIPAWAATDYINMDQPEFTLHFNAGAGFDQRTDTFFGSISGDPYLGTFVLDWGS
ncbi:MAG TPA: carboxypeptidase-like regulatory domain-containing protein [Planctomycetota bacterium]|nr:carboxypeptidase-like regulatory domain-containing protein [Planctomycetota bacterium]